MARREIEGDGAGPQAAGARPQDASARDPGPQGAAGRFLDVWEANQSEVSRLGPQVLAPLGSGAFRR